MPDNQSPEKFKLLEMLGAELHKVPAVPYSNPNQYQKVAARLAAALPNAIWANQFDNTVEPRGASANHRSRDLGADRRAARCVRRRGGTGGTLAGVSEFLKSQEQAGSLRARRSAGQQPL